MNKMIVAALAVMVMVMGLSAGSISEKDFKFLEKEPKIHKVFYFPNNNKLVVQVIPDGTPRNGLAEYIFLSLNDGKKKVSNNIDCIYIKSTLVSSKMIRNGEGNYIGKWIRR